MTHEAIMEKLNEIFQDIFDDDTLVITENTTANDIEDWDSLEPKCIFWFWESGTLPQTGI